MLSSIHPFGERSRNSSWGRTISAYLVGSIAGGTTTGLAFGLIGEVVDGFVNARLGLTLLGVAAIVGVSADLGVLGLGIPGPQRQVNERWLMAYRGWVYGAGFGFQLGLGLVTIVTTSSVWLTWFVAVMVGSWQLGALIGAAFGLARGVFIFAGARVDTPDRLRALHQSIAERAVVVQRMATAAVATTAVLALTLGVTS